MGQNPLFRSEIDYGFLAEGVGVQGYFLADRSIDDPDGVCGARGLGEDVAKSIRQGFENH